MGRTIEVRDAQLKTAAVEIKTLKVSGKQVTMGVFRQLLNEDLIDPDTAELAGLPWGKVNYFPKPCEPDHLHIVWQKGTELRRACVYPRMDHDSKWEYQSSIQKMQKPLRDIAAYIYMGMILENKPPRPASDHNTSTLVVGDVPFDIRWRHFTTYTDKPFWADALEEYLTLREENADRDASYMHPDRLPMTLGEYRAYQLVEARKRISVALKLEGDEDAETQFLLLAEAIANMRKACNEHGKKHRRHYDELDELDQLFIAV